MINNYINLIIGDMQLDDVTPCVMDKFYRDLLIVKSKARPNQPEKDEFLTPRTVKEIYKLLSNAFNQAVK